MGSIRDPVKLCDHTAKLDPKICSNLVEAGTKLAQNGADLIQHGAKMGSIRDPVKLCDHTAKLDPKICNNLSESGTKLAQNGADLVQNELLEHDFPVSSPSGDEPAGSSASGAASSSIT